MAANKGFLFIEGMPSIKEPEEGISRILLVRNGERVEKNYYVFWNKLTTNILKEEFANILEEKFKKD